MCGRFNVIDSPGLQQLLRDLGIDLQLPRAVNVAPTEVICLLREAPSAGAVAAAPGHHRATEGRRRVDPARWWLTPGWAPRVEHKYAMFNARSETLAVSRAFRHPFACQRGIVPMSSFIEWRQEGDVKQPWLVSNTSGALAAAALWDVWSGDGEALLSCTLVTTGAAPEFEPWHRRMPVLLTLEECDRWLDNRHGIAPDDEIFRSELKYPLQLSPLGRAVGNARNKDPRLLRATAESVLLAPFGQC
jgi:putative SOS response-associated peptidase YedK